MLTIVLMDEDVIMRLGLTILLDNHFKKIKILETDSLMHFNQVHADTTPDLFIIGNYYISKKKSVSIIQNVKDTFASTDLIVYDYRMLHNLTNTYLQLGVHGHLLRHNIGVELIDCVKAVLSNQIYVCSAIRENVLNQFFKPVSQSKLTARESVIAELLVQGKAVSWIAEAFEQTPSDIHTIKRSILKKIQVSSVSELGKLIQASALPVI